MTDNVVLEATYTILTQVTTPPAGNVAENAEITSSAETGTTIYYTLNGDPPTSTVSATNFQYSDTTKPILETDNTTLKAIAVKSGMTDSTVLEATYTFDLDETYNVAQNEKVAPFAVDGSLSP